MLDDHTDGAYAVLRCHRLRQHAARKLSIDYRLFSDLDPQHRGLLHLRARGWRARRC